MLKGNDYSYQYIFDAKYRIDYAQKGSYYQKHYTNPGPMEEDINTMFTAIGIQSSLPMMVRMKEPHLEPISFFHGLMKISIKSTIFTKASMKSILEPCRFCRMPRG